VKKARQDLTQELGRKPTKPELASVLEIDQQALEDLIYCSLTPLSLNQKFGCEEDKEFLDVIEGSDAATPNEILEQRILRDQLQSALGQLSDREREIIELRFGLTDGKERTLQQIGQLQKLSRERVRQIQGKAMRKLRHPSVRYQLRDFH
jgi:RNA polymerase primary sigma factor